MEKGSIIAVKEEPAEPMLSGDRDDDLDRVAKLQNSIVNHDAKIKKDSQFDFQTVYDRLKLVGTELYPIDLDEDTKYFGVTRKFISRVYGGGMIPTFPNINPELLRMHGIDNFAFPSLDYNPHAPVVPGAPGLFMILGGTASDYGTHGEWDSEWYRVFVSYKKDAFWTYMGNYRFLLAPFLSVSEFAMQSALVKRTWARNIRVREWGQGAVARIILRRELGREPTKDEIEGQFEEEERTIKENRQRQKNKQNEGASGMMQTMKDRITDDDVIEALLSGKEVIGVYCMKCIGYDVEFQQFLKRTFIRSQRNELMGRNSRQAKATRKKRKLAERAAESSDAPTNGFGNGGELNDVGGEGTLTEGELVYRPRGTRSRPGSSKAKAIEVD
ncbi:hypothetical protein K474DRAFT_591135 [Panus rudis PR-1116 ss-1]|nr:hypothetical protein K474DRAFT_591135 [Panus rudis PR-1116 ss-1]